ncbi:MULTISPECIES: ABC transporter permease [Streptomyces]|jgi:osmoprotectant transport system permease protein|uniref:ABC transporter permease n=1 Tax=unclassified Streptomyces TaxID=2593676 RepID=UPI0008827786|nr:MULTISPECIES: ABC transporter permease [unclassified Streptomyces]MDX2728450.1 ABC transporter permease [Streptomyces sp. PA03-2a]MDX3769230.1 ABC transporter permease [Streptomyces sp. AK08-01B]MDX3818294.1 ABC transporter permease [Streptomyces sp. AK08-01A]SCZ06727.1 osmoprotectant transport system permease protein [Streptomyces sp. 136MFCol5.1]SFT18455.1 osmoprotectant transport system permease protein [Streptomyces sp. ok210]
MNPDQPVPPDQPIPPNGSIPPLVAPSKAGEQPTPARLPGELEVRGLPFHDEEEEPAPPPAGPPRRITWRKLVLVPAALAVVLVATYLWITNIPLDSIARNSLSGGNVQLRWWQHVELTAISTFWVLIIAVPLGIALTRRRLRKGAPLVTAVANIGQATPAIGLLALLVIWLGIGPRTAIIGMVIYAVLPVLSNTVAGLKAIEPNLVEASRGIGMSAMGTLTKVELPLAVPLILAGVRTALVLNVGTATLATFGGGGGLGDLITSGIQTQRMPVLVLGSVLTVVLALLVDWLASLVEVALTPRGLEVG